MTESGCQSRWQLHVVIQRMKELTVFYIIKNVWRTRIALHKNSLHKNSVHKNTKLITTNTRLITTNNKLITRNTKLITKNTKLTTKNTKLIILY